MEIGAGSGTSIPTGIDTFQTYVNGPNPRPNSNSRIDAELANDVLAVLSALENDLYRTRIVDARSYSSFSLAVTAAIGKTLLICSSVTLTENTTIDAATSVLFLKPGVINGNGKTLTIAGTIVGNPMHQIFSGFLAGEVLINSRGNLNVIHPIWFGMKGDWIAGSGTSGATNNAAWAVLIASLNLEHVYPVIVFPPDALYRWTSTMIIDRACTIYWNQAKLDCSGDAGLNNVAINITAAGVNIHDGPYVSSGSLSTNQATNGIGVRIINDDITLYRPNISEFTTGLAIVAGDNISVINTTIFNPTIANCVTLFDCSAGITDSSFNNINVYGGYMQNSNLTTYNITNARNIKLDGGGSNYTSDNVNFWGTILESKNINGGTKVELIDVAYCQFNNAYWDDTSVVTTGKDIHILSSCNNITLNGGASLGNQKITNGCTSLTVVDPTKGMVLSGGRRLADASGATDDHAGYMQKWILQNDTYAVYDNNEDAPPDPVPSGFTRLPDATSGILTISAGVEGGILLISSSGGTTTVTIVSGTANLVNTDITGKLCVYAYLDRVIIKNRTAGSVKIRAEYTYL